MAPSGAGLPVSHPGRARIWTRLLPVREAAKASLDAGDRPTVPENNGQPFLRRGHRRLRAGAARPGLQSATRSSSPSAPPEALFCALFGILNPGDEVIDPHPRPSACMQPSSSSAAASASRWTPAGDAFQITAAAAATKRSLPRSPLPLSSPRPTTPPAASTAAKALDAVRSVAAELCPCSSCATRSTAT